MSNLLKEAIVDAKALREARITEEPERRLIASLNDCGPRLGAACAVL